jgi:hypothetical protein
LASSVLAGASTLRWNEHGPTPVEIHETKTIKPARTWLLGHMKAQGWVAPVGDKKWKAIAEARSETR